MYTLKCGESPDTNDHKHGFTTLLLAGCLKQVFNANTNCSQAKLQKLYN